MSTRVLEGGAAIIDDGDRPSMAGEGDPHNMDIHQIPDWLPKPVGYSLLVALPEQLKVTDGGIYIPDSVAEREQAQSAVCYVLAMGPDCYTHPTKFPSGPWCKNGDWIMIKSYAGTRFYVEVADAEDPTTKRKIEYRLVNDDAVQAVTTAPKIIKRGY